MFLPSARAAVMRRKIDPPVVNAGGDQIVSSGVPMVHNCSATGNPTSWSMSGAPSGMSISNTGTITGTPIAKGVYTVVVTAYNAAGGGSGTFTLTVS